MDLILQWYTQNPPELFIALLDGVPSSASKRGWVLSLYPMYIPFAPISASHRLRLSNLGLLKFVKAPDYTACFGICLYQKLIQFDTDDVLSAIRLSTRAQVSCTRTYHPPNRHRLPLTPIYIYVLGSFDANLLLLLRLIYTPTGPSICPTLAYTLGDLRPPLSSTVLMRQCP